MTVQEEKEERESLYNRADSHAAVAQQALYYPDHLGPNALHQYALQHPLPHNTPYQTLQPTNHCTREYDGTVVDGQGVAHQGDNYGVITINNSGFYQVKEHDAYKDKFNKLMENLTFDRMDARLHNVAIAIPKTCGWVRNHSQFENWSNKREVQKHNGFLWIEGKPGCGKSP